ncbi:MAG: hypothetical protein GEV11_06035 [Streptosporangiales bacterium]|nr:hypothetical protein [Streptosporangiales bacterium]
MSERQAPFYCPYCGDEDLEPLPADVAGGGTGAGAAWRCRACLRAFRLKFVGLGTIAGTERGAVR